MESGAKDAFKRFFSFLAIIPQILPVVCDPEESKKFFEAMKLAEATAHPG